jgi:hypothetical protein
MLGTPGPKPARVDRGGHRRQLHIMPAQQHRQCAGVVGIAAEIGIQVDQHPNTVALEPHGTRERCG